MNITNVKFAGPPLAISCCLAAYAYPEAFLGAYCVSFMYFLGLTLGAMGFILIHSLTGGEWGFHVRPILDRMAGRIYPLAFLSLPLIAWIWLFEPWKPSHFAPERQDVLDYYLNRPFMTVRLLFYFLYWSWLYSSYKTRTKSGQYAPQGFSAANLFFLISTLSFASIDWIMSLTPPWHSTIFGLIIAVASASASLAFAVLLYNLKEHVDARLRWDYAKILITTIILVTYLSYSQYLITWSGNLKEDVIWYLPRVFHEWSYVIGALLLCYCLAPFLMLLFAGRDRLIFLIAGSLIVSFFYIHLIWIICPALPHGNSPQNFISLALSLGLVGLFWLAAFRRPSEALSTSSLSE